MPKPILIVCALAAAGAFVLYSWREGSTLPPVEDAVERKELARHASQVDHSPVPEGVGTNGLSVPSSTGNGPVKGRLEEAYARAHDNLQLILRFLADAQHGDGNAQFHLFSALDYCKRNYTFYFLRGDRRLTLDEGLVWATRGGGMTAEEAREVHHRCQELMDKHPNEFGSPDDWLARAAESGHPEAQLTWAERMLMAAELSSHVDQTSSVTKQAGAEERALAKDYLLQGLKRRDASAVWKIADLQAALTGSLTGADKNQWVWRLAACKLGYDCSQDAEWYQFMCRFDFNCQPNETGVDLILRSAAGTYPDVELRADELVQDINRGNLTDLNWR